MKNRKCRKTVHKKYRFFRSDIWSIIARKRKDNFITNLLSSFAKISLRNRLKRFQKNHRKGFLKTFFGKQDLLSQQRFAYQVNSKPSGKRNKRSSNRAQILKLRKLISLYYAGARIRKNTYIKLKELLARKKVSFFTKENLLVVKNFPTNFSFFESKIEVLLLRSNFIFSIYQSKNEIINKRVYVNKMIINRSKIVKLFETFNLNYNRRKSLFLNWRKDIVNYLESKTHLTKKQKMSHSRLKDKLNGVFTKNIMRKLKQKKPVFRVILSIVNHILINYKTIVATKISEFNKRESNPTFPFSLTKTISIDLLFKTTKIKKILLYTYV